MKKTTVEIALESGFKPNAVYAILPMINYAQHSVCDQLETFRRLVIEECAKVCDRHSNATWNDDRKAQAKLIRNELHALKSQPACGGEGCTEVCQACAQPAAPDPRDEVIRQQSEALRMAREAVALLRSEATQRRLVEFADEALAAIDKMMKEGK